MLQLIPGQRVHFIGIGGTGLSAIARVLLDQGFQISGSDLHPNAMTDSLAKDGAVIYRGHDAGYVGDAELVIASSAVSKEHIEILTAMAQGIPVYKRSDIIRAVMAGHFNIAVAGTHGKTTTTSMIIHILQQAGRSPSFIVGGLMGNTGKNAGIGTGDEFVIEADEYDNMFHGLRPRLEVITNVEYDHPDFFKTPHESIQSFSSFVGLLPDNGMLVACADDAIASIFLRNRIIVNLPTISYGIVNPQANWRATDIHTTDGKTVFNVVVDGAIRGEVALSVPGHHNVLNSLAALIVADQRGVEFEVAVNALVDFKNSGRRFDIRGEMDGVILVDDYAHHPTEIRATLSAARQRYPDHEIWAVWQPHTYSRVMHFSAAFVTAFDDADHVLVTDIYAAREKPIAGISANNVVVEMNHPRVYYKPALTDAVEYLREHVKSPAIILVMSAGDATLIAEEFLHPKEQEQ